MKAHKQVVVAVVVAVAVAKQRRPPSLPVVQRHLVLMTWPKVLYCPLATWVAVFVTTKLKQVYRLRLLGGMPKRVTVWMRISEVGAKRIATVFKTWCPLNLNFELMLGAK